MTTSYAPTGQQNKNPVSLFLPSNQRTHYETASDRESSATGSIRQWVSDLLACGSGSRSDSIFATLKKQIVPVAYGGHWTVPTLPLEDAAVEAAPPTMFEKLGMIRDAFGLSVGSLAEILKASRASVYNWLEHELPTERFVQRIDQLYAVAKEWDSLNVYHYPPGKLMKQKLGDGPSMHDHLRREDLDMGEIRKGLKDLLALMHNQRQKMNLAKERSSKAQGDAASQSELLERITGSVTVTTDE